MKNTGTTIIVTILFLSFKILLQTVSPLELNLVVVLFLNPVTYQSNRETPAIVKPDIIQPKKFKVTFL